MCSFLDRRLPTPQSIPAVLSINYTMFITHTVTKLVNLLVTWFSDQDLWLLVGLRTGMIRTYGNDSLLFPCYRVTLHKKLNTIINI